MKFIEKFMARCVCEGLELYFRKYRLTFNHSIEIIPLKEDDFKKHLMKVFQGNPKLVKDYLENAPTTTPQEEQTTK